MILRSGNTHWHRSLPSYIKLAFNQDLFVTMKRATIRDEY